MSEQPEDDRELDALLERRSTLSQHYRDEAQATRTPESLDAAVLNFAKREHQQRELRAIRRWKAPLAAAATLMLVAGLVYVAKPPTPQDAMQAASAPVQMPTSKSAAAMPAPPPAPAVGDLAKARESLAETSKQEQRKATAGRPKAAVPQPMMAPQPAAPPPAPAEEPAPAMRYSVPAPVAMAPTPVWILVDAEFDGAAPTAAGRETLDSAVSNLASEPTQRVRISCTQPARRTAVAAYLETKGIAAVRFVEDAAAPEGQLRVSAESAAVK